ncbi:trafficking protein particle complex subunit 12-like [Babylonia areolata]|uniref:trafficking protein particle complex subunit 12-like n=1 Tax=Babylonia areolata TaxID=304850 RepID=UPI003FD1BEB4
MDDNTLYEEENLAPPVNSSALVNSPTTDTLDSVALEPSPCDEQDLVEEELLPTDSDTGNQPSDDIPGITENPKDTGISLTTAAIDVSIDLNSSVIPSASESQTDQSVIANADETSDPHPQYAAESQNISSYFSNHGGGDDFFDSLGTGETESSPERGFDDTGEDMTTAERQEADSDEDHFQSLAPTESQENKPDKDVNEDITRVIHREHKISQSEPETVAFEGVEENEKEAPAISELTEYEKDEFESFTAGEGNDVIHHTGLVERSDSIPQAHTTCGEQPVREEEIGIMVQGLSIQGPSVGTTPTQMSPQHTPVHQPAFSQPSPQKGTTDPPKFDRQPSVPGSPFHAPDSGPPSGGFPSFSDVAGTDDIFTASLCVSDTDRRCDAWIPSDATRHILIAKATSPPGTFSPAVEQLSCPGVLNSEPQGDPVRDLVYRYMGEQEAVRRHVLTADSVSQDCSGLQKLVDSGCLRAAVDLTGRLLVSGGQGETNMGQPTEHSPDMLQLWFCRFALMVKLRLYEMAECEMRAFQNLDTPDLYFEFYPQQYPGRRGSMVCFAMRMLHAELPHLNGRSQETLDRLYYMLAVVRKVITNLDSDLCEDGSAGHLSLDCRKLSKDLWLEREQQVLYNIASTLLSVRDYQAALAVYNTLLDKDVAKRAQLLTGISRIHLQMGNVAKANEIHSEVEKLMSKGDNLSACCNAMNRGLSAMCINNFSEAYNHFKTAVQLEPDNTCAVNNMAVCSLYLGRLKDALNTLEAMVHSDPARNLHEGILFNLCTLYELESSRALHKKQAVLDLVSKHKGDGFPIACLKMA